MAAFEDEWLLMQQGYSRPGPATRLQRLRARLRGRSRPGRGPATAVRIDPTRG